MKGLAALAAVAGALALSSLAFAEDLSAKKVHLMDVSPTGNYLFRGNMPIITSNGNKSFAYTQLLALMANRTAEAGVNWPANNNVHISILSFNNFLEADDTKYEKDFAEANPSLVDVTFWPLVGQLFSPAVFDSATQQQLVTDDSSLLWAIDQLPGRMGQLRQDLLATYSTPRAYYIHCEAGCDRTGEFAASYYMQFGAYDTNGTTLSQPQALARDTAECGRLPYNVSIQAFQWYCVWLGPNDGTFPVPCY